MAVQSAKNGSASWNGTAIDHVTNITLNEVAEEQTYASSSTAGLRSRTVGHIERTGSFTVLDVADIPFSVGDTGTLTLKRDGSSNIFNLGATITAITPSVPIGDGGNVSAEVTFGQKPDSSS